MSSGEHFFLPFSFKILFCCPWSVPFWLKKWCDLLVSCLPLNDRSAMGVVPSSTQHTSHQFTEKVKCFLSCPSVLDDKKYLVSLEVTKCTRVTQQTIDWQTCYSQITIGSVITTHQCNTWKWEINVDLCCNRPTLCTGEHKTCKLLIEA